MDRPAEDEIARVIYQSKPRNKPWDVLQHEFKNQYRKSARAIVALFDPILAEKERLAQSWEKECEERTSIGKMALDRALAAEAALAAAFGQPAEVFVKAQALWDMQRAEEPDASVAARARILSRYPLRDMIKRGWIDPEDQSRSLEQQICTFFDVSSLDDVPHLAHAAKKTRYDDIPPAQLAWLFRVQKIASEMVVSRYERHHLEQAIERLSELRSDPALVRKVPRILADAGVRFVVVECLPGSKIDGVCFWLDEQSPVIGMSLRFDRIDNFWFVLRHECAHVVHGHGKQSPIVDSDINDPDADFQSDEERTANAEAAEFCVPSKRLENFYLRKRPFFPEREVIAFAKTVNAHPGLIVGQLQRKMNRYDLLRQHLVKIKEQLSASMMFDGWGDVIPTER